MSVPARTQVFPGQRAVATRALKQRLVVLDGERRPPGKHEIIGREDSPPEFAGYARSPAQDAAIEAELAGSKARRLTAAAAILSRHWKQKNSVEEAMLELYHASISAAKADEVARLLWGGEAGIALVSECCEEISRRIRGWLQRKIAEPQVYVFFQLVAVKQKLNGETRTAQLVAAIGVNRSGIRQGLAVMDATAADGLWERLVLDLKQRGLRETALFVGGNHPAASAAVTRHFPKARYQGSLPQLQRAALSLVPVSEVHSLMLAFDRLAQHTSEPSALAEAAALVARLRLSGQGEAATLLEQCAAFQFSYLRFPSRHWGRLHDIEPLKNVLSEFRDHIRVIGPVSSDDALLLMVAASLRQASRLAWARRRFIHF